MMKIYEFFDSGTNTLSYLVIDKQTRDAVVIDPVLDFDITSGTFSSKSLQRILDTLRETQSRLVLILETHVHADHVTGAQVLKSLFPTVKVAIGEHIIAVQSAFKSILNLVDLVTDGSQFDVLLRSGEEFKAGSLTFKALATPGHTPACMSYVFGEHVFTGDSLFTPDSGTGRCDFPGGDAVELHHSIHEVLYGLPENFRLYVGHDYQPEGRELRFSATIKEQKTQNIHLRADTTETEFVSFRRARDKTLSPPRLLYPSIQINANGGLPKKEANGICYVKIPLGTFPTII